MKKEYHKLVRDRIPEIIRATGTQCEISSFTESDYRQALRQKLIEEAQEAAEATEADLITELADLYEVIDTLMFAYGMSQELVLATQEKRRNERGSFQQKIQLLWTESEES